MLTWLLPLFLISYFFALRLSTTWGGILAIFWICSSPFVMHNAMLTKMDIPLTVMFTLFFFLFYLFYKKEGRNHTLRWIIPGIVLGLSIITKYQAVLMIIPAFFVLLKRHFPGNDPDKVQVSKIIFPAITGIAIIVIPWLIYSHLGGGSFLFRMSEWFQKIYYSDPTEYRNISPVLNYWHILYKNIGYPIVFFFILNVLLAIRTKDFKKESFLLFISWILTVLIFFSVISLKSLTGRYFLPLVPALILFSVQTLTERFSEKMLVTCLFSAVFFNILLHVIYLNGGTPLDSKPMHILSATILIALSILIFTPGFRSKVFQYSLIIYSGLLIGAQGTVFYTDAAQSTQKPFIVKTVGEWIRSNTAQNDLILTNSTQVAYYSDRNYYLSQYDKTGSLEKLLDNKRIKIVYFDRNLGGLFDERLPGDKRKKIIWKIQREFKLIMSQNMGIILLYQRI
jgi:4-amino-4-deoxy-L-arabinose transferase-like glycosyltransferase